jgi:hypothetical protein
MIDCTTTRHSNYATTPEKVEVAAGVLQRLDRCAVSDLTAARQIETRKARLRTEAEMLLSDAARHDIPIGEDLRERLALWAEDLPTIAVLVDELRLVVLQPA